MGAKIRARFVLPFVLRLGVLDARISDGVPPVSAFAWHATKKTTTRIRRQQHCGPYHCVHKQEYLRQVVAKPIMRFCTPTAEEEDTTSTIAELPKATPATRKKSASKKTNNLGKKNDEKQSSKKKRKTKAKSDDNLHWINETDEFALVVNTTTTTTTNGAMVLDRSKVLLLHNDNLADNNTQRLVGSGSCHVLSLTFSIRGNPLPLRRHRTSRGFVYNPSAPAQASFRNQTSMLVFGVPADQVHAKNNNTNNNNETTSSTSSPLAPPLFAADTSLAVTIILRLKRPLSHFRSSKRQTCTLKANAPAALSSMTRTDADNLAKFVLDACNGLLYADDKQVQSLHVIKQLDNQEQCLGCTQLLIRTIDDSMEQDISRHAMEPYCPSVWQAK